MVAVKSTCEKATNVNVLDVVHLVQEDLVNGPVGKGDLDLLPICHPLKLDIALLRVPTCRSP